MDIKQPLEVPAWEFWNWTKTNLGPRYFQKYYFFPNNKFCCSWRYRDQEYIIYQGKTSNAVENGGCQKNWIFFSNISRSTLNITAICCLATIYSWTTNYKLIYLVKNNILIFAHWFSSFLTSLISQKRSPSDHQNISQRSTSFLLSLRNHTLLMRESLKISQNATRCNILS